MIVTKVEAVAKARFRVELDGRFAFVLYGKELSHFGIREREELAEDVYARIRKDVVLKRAKLRALHLLTNMARTESGLRGKLEQGLYPEDVIEEALAYVRSFGYLDDLRYAENFIESKKDRKSRKELYALLRNKGVPARQIEQAFESCFPGEEEELDAIRRVIQKKRVDVGRASEEELQKLYGYLMRKGFCHEDVRKAFREWRLCDA